MFGIIKIAHSMPADTITDTLYLIHQSGVFLCGAITQHIGAKTMYIESLDTTGYCTPRSHQRHVTSSLINHILDMDFELFAVFSHPKKETIFGKSSLNSQKGYLGARRLQEFWVSHFSRDCVFVFSNFCDKKTIPFATMDGVMFFHDDPKQKLGVKDVNVNTFFEMLLHRKDFQRGSLVYMAKKNVNGLQSSKSERRKCGRSCNHITNRKSGRQVDVHEGDRIETVRHNHRVERPNRARDAALFLRSSDFSTLDKGVAATRLFLELFSPESEPFSVKERRSAVLEETRTTVLEPRRR